MVISIFEPAISGKFVHTRRFSVSSLIRPSRFHVFYPILGKYMSDKNIVRVFRRKYGARNVVEKRPSVNYTKSTTDNRCRIRGCRAAKEHSRGINHVLREFFSQVNEHDIYETENAGSTSCSQPHSTVHRLRGTLNAKLAIVSAYDKSATRLFSRTFVSGDVV
jgi:hypothetical protein